MKWFTVAVAATGLATSVAAQSDTVEYTDAETGIKYQSYTDTNTGAAFRIALPDKTDGDYDAIVQIEAPADLGWVGLAWAGTMAYNPLTITWANANTVVHSSRMAYGFYSPSVYNGSSFQVLKGTGIAGGKLKFTAVCKGCTTWKDYDGNPQTLDLSQPTQIAFALSHTAVDTPADNSSTFYIHDNVGHWYADLAAAKSPDFETWVAKNSNASANGTSEPSIYHRRRLPVPRPLTERLPGFF